MTNRLLIIFIAATLTLFGCTQRTPEMQIIEDVSEAMGGRRSVLRAENLVFQGTSGRQYRLGQNRDPNDDLWGSLIGRSMSIAARSISKQDGGG